MQSFALKLFPPNVMERATGHPQIPGAISLEMNVSHSYRCGHWVVFDIFLRFVLDDTVLLRRLLGC